MAALHEARGAGIVARPFPVCDDYAPPFPAPPSPLGLRIDVGPPPPLDVEAEIARTMRHQ